MTKTCNNCIYSRALRYLDCSERGIDEMKAFDIFECNAAAPPVIPAWPGNETTKYDDHGEGTGGPDWCPGGTAYSGP